MTTLYGKNIKIAELAAVEMRVIEDYCFVDCNIDGPACLIAWESDCKLAFNSCIFNNSSTHGLQAILTQGPITYRHDLIGIRNTKFQNCIIRDIHIYAAVAPPDSFLKRVVEPRDKLIQQQDMDRLWRRVEEVILKG